LAPVPAPHLQPAALAPVPRGPPRRRRGAVVDGRGPDVLRDRGRPVRRPVVVDRFALLRRRLTRAGPPSARAVAPAVPAPRPSRTPDLASTQQLEPKDTTAQRATSRTPTAT